MRALAQHGPCPEHRASFANVNGLVRDVPVMDRSSMRPEPMAELDRAGGAGPEMAGQAVTQAVRPAVATARRLTAEMAPENCSAKNWLIVDGIRTGPPDAGSDRRGRT